MTKSRYNPAFLLFLFLTLSLGFAASPGQPAIQLVNPGPVIWNGDFAEGWKQFDQLKMEQKYEAALSLVEKMLAAARAQKNNEEWTRCLIRYALLRMYRQPPYSMDIYSFAASVRFLKEQPWPEDLAGSSVLNLYYAKALVFYAQEYSFAINRRKKADSKAAMDLNVWTLDQINDEAQKTFEKVWKVRSQLGEISKTQWSEYIDPNNYPSGIRPTLRDAVSYMWAKMLSDSRGWQPDQINELYRLNLKRLAGDNTGEISLIGPEHPLEKICYILADLENWHAQRKETEAAMEARIERYRQLYQHFDNAEDRKFIQNELESFLKPLAALPWWSAGMHQLAEFIRSDNEPDSLTRARKIAIKGETAYPESIGGKLCLATQTSIEMAEFSLAGMQNDNPQNKSLLVTHKNLDKIFFRAYSIDLVNAIETSDEHSFSPDDLRSLDDSMAYSSPAYQWEVQLPATPDYRMHRTFVIPPMTKPGAYLVVASPQPKFRPDNYTMRGLFMTVGDLAIVSRRQAKDLEVTVFSGSNGRPIAGAEVVLYEYGNSENRPQKESKISDKRGIVRFTLNQEKDDYSIIARNRNSIAFDSIRYDNEWPDPTPVYSTIIFTDRSMYQPLQKMRWKAMSYKISPTEMHFETIPGATLTIYFRDTFLNNVESKTVTTNSFGTASGEFTIPSGGAPGQWYIGSSNGGGSSIQVGEFTQPDMKARIIDPKEPLRLNTPANMQGAAKYNSGLPVSAGKVTWSVKRQQVSLDSMRRAPVHFNVGSSQIIASGIESTKNDGSFTFTFTPEVDKTQNRQERETYKYTVFASITDEAGKTCSAQRSFRLGNVSVEIWSPFDADFYPGDAPEKISIFRRSLDGAPKAGKGTWRIVRLRIPSETLFPPEWPSFLDRNFTSKNAFQTPGDLERKRWDISYNYPDILRLWDEGSIQASGSIIHDDIGEGEIIVGRLAPGAYSLLYETADEFGKKYELRRRFIVGASTLALPFPALLMIDDMPAVGEKARLFVHSGFKDQFMILEIYRGTERIQRKEMISQIHPLLVEIPIMEKDRGGLKVRLSLLHDNQFVQFEGFVMIRPDDKKLRVELTTFRDRLQPGPNESWTVKVTNPGEKDAAVAGAELLAYMYDRRQDILVPHSPPNPFRPYSSRQVVSHLPSAWASLGEATTLWHDNSVYNRQSIEPSLIDDQLVGTKNFRLVYAGPMLGYMGHPLPLQVIGNKVRDFFDDIRNSMPPEIERPFDGDSQPELQGDLSETVFWLPHLVTGPDGSATFEFKVPDDISSWNVWVHALAKNYRPGFVHREVQTVKKLVVQPYIPSFLREGDRAEIKMAVKNASDHEIKGSINFDIIDVATHQSVLSQFGLSKADASNKLFTVAKSGETNLIFPVTVPSTTRKIAVKVTATSGDFSDGELCPLSVMPGHSQPAAAERQ